MPLSVELKTTAPACVAFLPMTGPYAQIPAAMGRLYGWVAGHGLAPGGMPAGVYLTDPAEGEATSRWELQAPLAADHPDAPVDREGCGVKHLAPRLVASAIHRGPYERIGAAYAQLAGWVSEHGYAMAGPPEEVYFSDPSTPPVDTITEIRFPIEKV